jgi:hypothetical protein
MLFGPADVQNALSCRVVSRRFHPEIDLHKDLLPAKIKEYRFWPSGKIFDRKVMICPVKEGKDDDPRPISLKIVPDIVEIAFYFSLNTELSPELLREARHDIELTGYMLHEEENIHFAHLDQSLRHSFLIIVNVNVIEYNLLKLKTP